MPRPRTRTLAAALGAALLLPALATVPSAQAVIGSASFTLDDCDVVLDPVSTNQVISSNQPWSTSITVDHPSPLPVGSGQTVGVTLGQVPANTIPESLGDASYVAYVEFEDGMGYTREYVTPRRSIGDLDPTQPLPLGEEEVDDVVYFDSGHYSLGLKKITINIFGYQADGTTFRDYYFECDQPTVAVPIVEFGVFDPAADAQVALDAVQATQGQSIGINGRDFKNVVGSVTPTVGGEPANALAIDEIGFFDGQLVVPEFAPPGQQEVRVTYQGETASTFLTVVAKKAQLGVASKAVKAGKALGVTGSLFKPGEKVTLKLKKKGPAKKGTKKAYGSSVTAGPDGSISKAVKLKKAAKGSWKISAKGASSGRTAASGFKVT